MQDEGLETGLPEVAQEESLPEVAQDKSLPEATEENGEPQTAEETGEPEASFAGESAQENPQDKGMPAAAEENGEPEDSFAGESAAEKPQDKGKPEAAEENGEPEVAGDKGEQEIPDLHKTVAALAEEIRLLQERLEHAADERARVIRELTEFRSLYPEVPLSRLPQTVWEDFSRGVPPAASYALCERRRARDAEHARLTDEENRRQASPAAGRSPGGTLFSPEEVRAMSREEVRTHYAAILDSMKRWAD